MKENIPNFLDELLIKDYGKDLKNEIIKSYTKEKLVTLRVNNLKANIEEIKEELNKANIKFREVNWNKDALIIENVKEDIIKKLKIYEEGKIYLQNLSAMIPALVLDAKAGENILDMAAAPGGKTMQIAALTNNDAMITACEKNKIRAERLKYNLERQGCMRVNVITEDARKLDDFFSFDKVLLDSPCSGSGTENVFSLKFTKELIKRSAKAQKELLKKAIKILKPGGELVYSTCSILKMENEESLNSILKNSNIEVIPISTRFLDEVPMLDTSISGTVCIRPTDLYEGFFIAKLRKNK